MSILFFRCQSEECLTPAGLLTGPFQMPSVQLSLTQCCLHFLSVSQRLGWVSAFLSVSAPAVSQPHKPTASPMWKLHSLNPLPKVNEPLAKFAKLHLAKLSTEVFVFPDLPEFPSACYASWFCFARRASGTKSLLSLYPEHSLAEVLSSSSAVSPVFSPSYVLYIHKDFHIFSSIIS